MKYLVTILLLVCSTTFGQVTLQNAKLQNAQFGLTNSTGGGGGGAAKIFDVEIGGTSGGCTTSAADSTGTTLLIGATGGYRSPYPAQSDSKVNSWTGLTGYTDGGGAAVRLWYVTSPTVGSGHAFSADGGDVGTAYSSDAALGFSGVITFDAQSGISSFATSGQPGSIAPSNSGEVFVTCICGNAGGSASTWSIDSGFTILYQGLTGGGLYFAVAYKIKTDGTAENPTWTRVSGSSPTVSCAMACWK